MFSHHEVTTRATRWSQRQRQLHTITTNQQHYQLGSTNICTHTNPTNYKQELREITIPDAGQEFFPFPLNVVTFIVGKNSMEHLGIYDYSWCEKKRRHLNRMLMKSGIVGLHTEYRYSIIDIWLILVGGSLWADVPACAGSPKWWQTLSKICSQNLNNVRCTKYPTWPEAAASRMLQMKFSSLMKQGLFVYRRKAWLRW